MIKPLIIANWKLNPASLKGAKLLFDSVGRGIKNVKHTEVVICPPFVYLPVLNASSFAPTSRSFGGLVLGSQDVFWEGKGAFTGEISPLMLKDLGCQYVIIGHSERRRHLKETDEMINKKIKAVLEAKLNPILCIGETEKERNKGKTSVVLRKQLCSALKNVPCSLFSASYFVIAYEPIWAIGTGKACLPEEGKKANVFIRKVILQIYNPKIAENIRILYGGSVNSQNARAYLEEAGLNGLLVGGASLNAKEFVEIVKAAPRL